MVVDELGLPVATAKVAIVGQAGTQTTSASGTFSFPGLGHAYSIVAALGTANAVEYVGVTRSDPKLVLPMYSNGAYRTATLNLTTSPSPSTGTTWAAAWVPPAGDLSAASFAAAAGSASLPFQWAGASSTVNGNVAAFERDSGGLFVRAGSVSGVALVDTQTSSLAVPMSAVAGGTVTGSAVRSTPAQQFWWSTTLVAEIGRVLLPIASLSMSEGAYTLPTPRGTGYNLRVVGTASDTSSGASQACKSVLPDATGANLSVPLGPIQTAPASSATGVSTSTSFGWTAAGASLHRLEVSSPSYRVAIYTTSNTATLADLTAAGFTLPATASSSWLVTSAIPSLGIIGPAPDDAAAGPWMIDCNSARTTTATRTFTTQ